MKRTKKPLRRAIPTDLRGRVDYDRLVADIDWENLSEVEKLVFGSPGDFDKLFDEVKVAPELARLRWGQNDDSILHWAVGYAAIKLVRLLVRLGSDVNASCAGERPLHWAAQYGSGIEIGALLLKHGAAVNALSGTGRTALHEAVVQQRLPFVKLLLAHGADVHIKDNWGRTPADLAALRAYPEIVVELLRQGAQIERRESTAALRAMQEEGWLRALPDGTLELTPATLAALQGSSG
jgi:hypothetical protein